MKIIAMAVLSIGLMATSTIAQSKPLANHHNSFRLDYLRSNHHFCVTSKCKKVGGSNRWSRNETDNSSDSDKVKSVPEINATGTAMAIALLSGLVLIRRERKKLLSKSV